MLLLATRIDMQYTIAVVMFPLRYTIFIEGE